MTRVMVYRPKSIWNREKGEVQTPPFYGTREGLQAISLKPVEGSGFELDESELDKNWLYHLRT